MERPISARSARSESVWAATQKMPRCGRLLINAYADVCVVGGGIAGLTTAYLLSKEGKSVILLDDGKLAGGMTQATTAHLSNEIDDGFVEMERWHGAAKTRLAIESHGAAIDCIERIATELAVDCEFHRLDGYLFLAPEHDERLIDDELAAARRCGFTNAEKLPRAPLDYDTGPCIRYPHQARFHPLKYLAALTRAVKSQGGRIYANSHVDAIEGGPTARIDVGRHTVRAGAVVVATNTPFNDLVAVHTKQAPYMTYAIGARVPTSSVTDALYWDTHEPYHYVRLERVASNPQSDGRGAHDLLIVGGEDHKTGQADDADQRHARLETWARARFPMIEDVEFHWGGQCLETVDGLAFIGRNPLDKDNVYIVTGDSGMGITHGTIAGMLLTDLILGRTNPWAELYDPARKTPAAAGRFLHEAANMAVQYTDWLTSGEVDSADEVLPASGAILRSGLTKVAVYRDAGGAVHAMSAVCPHLGCIVRWNPAESTWDCPCHGSRFSAYGELINGPANSDLEPIDT